MHWVLRKHLRPLEIVFTTRYLLIVLHRLWSLKANQTDIIKTVESILQSRNTWGVIGYFPADIKAGVLTCGQISSSLWEMSRVLALRKPYCGIGSKRVGVHFFRQISVSTTLLNRGRVYASRLWLRESTELTYGADRGWVLEYANEEGIKLWWPCPRLAPAGQSLFW